MPTAATTTIDPEALVAQLGWRRWICGAGWEAMVRNAPRLELEQALLRVILISIVAIGYSIAVRFYGVEAEEGSATWPLFAVTAYLNFSIWLLLDILARGGRLVERPWRRILAAVADNSGCSFFIARMGSAGALVFGLYLFVAFGNGFRYGTRYLFASQVMAVIGFSWAIAVSDFWLEHLTIGMGLLLGLIVLPIYVGGLSHRLKIANRRSDETSTRLRVLFENASIGIFLCDSAGRVHSYNPWFRDFFALPGDGTTALAPVFLPALIGEQWQSVRFLLRTCTEGRRTTQTDVLCSREDGSAFWLSIVFAYITDNEYEGVVTDITERKQAEDRARQEALLDPLTKLHNRLGFARKMDSVLAESAGGFGRGFAVMLIDLDRFKEVNDTLGHQIGDEVLIEAAQRLRTALRDSDFVARLGGDEFVAIVAGADKPKIAGRIAEKVIAAISAPFTASNGAVTTIGASVGMTFSSPPAVDATETLLKRADQALYSVKRAGRGHFAVYSSTLHAVPPPVSDAKTA